MGYGVFQSEAKIRICGLVRLVWRTSAPQCAMLTLKQLRTLNEQVVAAADPATAQDMRDLR
jgi:hypothetical protein